MSPALVAIAVPLAYLVGTLPTAQLVAARLGRDPMAEGSGNPGATNVARIAGWRAGVVVLLIDFAKGVVPTLVGWALAGRAAALALGIAAVLGHVLPLTRRLRGGKGVATTGGVLVVLFPILTAVAAVVFLVVVRLTHTSSVASLVISVGFPAAAGLLGAPWPETVALVALGVLVIVRHLPNLRRLVKGEELPLGPGSVSADEGET